MRGKRAETVDQLEAVRRAVPVIALGLAYRVRDCTAEAGILAIELEAAKT